MKTLIQNATIINEGQSFQGSVAIENDRIVKVSTSEITEDGYDEIIEAKGMLLIPGVIDDQVHFREPGLEHKAEIYTEAKAAVAGGVTSFMEMPNTIPQATTIDELEKKYTRANDVSLANYSFYIGATNDNLDEVLKANPTDVCGIKCFMGSSTGNMLVEGEPLVDLFKHAHMLVATHNEEESIIRDNMAKFKAKYGHDCPIEYHPLIRSAEACYTSTAKAVELAHKMGTHLHALHLSTAREMSLFESGDVSTKKITNEVCVHHLWFDDRDYHQYGTRIKWNPAIKSETDKLALREALNNNVIDVVATDHAPHTAEEKNNTYFKAPSGGPLVQHSLIAMLEMAHEGIFTYEKVIEKMCHIPAILFNVESRGYIREGYKADLVLVNPNRSYRVEEDNILSKCGWSPFEGRSFTHSVSHTFVNGNLVYKLGEFNETWRGERLRFNR